MNSAPQMTDRELSIRENQMGHMRHVRAAYAKAGIAKRVEALDAALANPDDVAAFRKALVIVNVWMGW
jgi:hypothetical protein